MPVYIKNKSEISKTVFGIFLAEIFRKLYDRMLDWNQGSKKVQTDKEKKNERINNNNQLVNIQLKIDESGIINNI